jgi:hypothetical protein
MYDDLKPHADDDVTDALRSIEELEESVSEAVLRRRTSPRHKVCTKVSVNAGNPSQRTTQTFGGITGDISGGGCLVFGTQAILPGDIFWIDFSPGDAADLGGVFARCLRCRFITEGRFELGFRFLQTLDVDYVLHDLLNNDF